MSIVATKAAPVWPPNKIVLRPFLVQNRFSHDPTDGDNTALALEIVAERKNFSSKLKFYPEKRTFNRRKKRFCAEMWQARICQISWRFMHQLGSYLRSEVSTQTWYGKMADELHNSKSVPQKDEKWRTRLRKCVFYG